MFARLKKLNAMILFAAGVAMVIAIAWRAGCADGPHSAVPPWRRGRGYDPAQLERVWKEGGEEYRREMEADERKGLP